MADPNDLDPIQPQGFDTTHKLVTKTADGKDLVVLSGYVEINGDQLHGNVDGTWKRKDLIFNLGPRWKTVDVVPIVSLSSIMNLNTSNNAGWAVDNCSVIDTFDPVHHTRQESLKCRVAVRDSDGHIFRVNYYATMVGQLA